MVLCVSVLLISIRLLPLLPCPVSISQFSMSASPLEWVVSWKLDLPLNSKTPVFHRKEGCVRIGSNCLSPCNYYIYLIFLDYLLLCVGNALGGGDLVRSLPAWSLSLRQTQFLSDAFMPSSRKEVQGERDTCHIWFCILSCVTLWYNHWYMYVSGNRITVCHIKHMKQLGVMNFQK